MKNYPKLKTSRQYQEHDAYWRTVLQGWHEDTQLRRHERAYAVPAQAVTLQWTAGAEASRVVEQLSGNKMLGGYLVVAAALSRLLADYSNQKSTALASPLLAAGSPSTLAETVPLVIEHQESHTVRQLLEQVRSQLSAAYTYQDFPLEELFEAMSLAPRKTNILFTCPELHGKQQAATQWELVVELKGLQPLQLEMRGNTFTEDWLTRMARHLEHHLAGFADKDRQIAEGVLRGEALHGPQRERPPYETAAAYFQAVVAQYPNRTALTDAHKENTYAELAEQVNNLAAYLKNEQGIKPGEVVAVLTGRTPLGIIALLAILQVGGVYLPIDAEYQEKRITYMATDADAKCLLIHSTIMSKLTRLYHIPMFAMDLQQAELPAAPEQDRPEVTAAHGAYIIYTSGTTGQPKGALLTHGGLLNMIQDHIQQFGITAQDVVTRFYAQAYDSSLFEIFIALLTGARLVTVDRETIGDPKAYAKLIAREQVTVAVFPPSYLATMDKQQLTSLRVVLNAGDASKVADATALAKQCTHYNSYGPTEGTVCATYYRVEPQRQYGARIPIGTPVANTSIYLLDPQGRRVPPGVPGELCLAGAGLARGYHNRRALTAARFVPHPQQHGERLYRTGDLAILLEDGNLEFVGRTDAQVKIRGYRVEPGEIEAVLSQKPELEEVVVIDREIGGEKALVAYYTADETETSEELRSYLESRLPDYMMPARYVANQQWPKTGSGKVDRKALRQQPMPEAESETDYQPPQGETEQTLADIWAETLGVPRVGRDDSFFTLGGDSIQGIRMAAQASKKGLIVTPKQLFDQQTLAALARVATKAPVLTREQGPITGAVPLSAIQRWFFSQNLAEPDYYNQTVQLTVPKDLDQAAMKAALAAVITHHDALRTQITEVAGEKRIDQQQLGGEAPYRTQDLTKIPEAHQQQAIKETTNQLHRAIEMASGEMVQVCHWKTGGERDRLLIVIHHLLVDGVSWRIILEDYQAAYAELAAGQQPELPAKTTSVREWAGSQAKQAQTEYWRAVTEAVQPIPVDKAYQRQEVTQATRKRETYDLTEAETQQLLREAPAAYNTRINDHLLTALLMAYRNWTGQKQLSLNLEGHGREGQQGLDLTRTVGWLTAIYPVNLKQEHEEVGQVLKTVKEQLRAIPNNGIDYGPSRYHAAEPRQGSTPEVVFNYLGQTDEEMTGDWQLSHEETEPEQSPQNRSDHLLEITAIVNRGRLRTEWQYSTRVHEQATIAKLAKDFGTQLKQQIEHCNKGEQQGYTPSDFPESRMNQTTLDKVIARLNA